MAYKRNRDAFEADLQKHESPYVLYGTPLPPLDIEVRDDGSYVPIWQQEVRDEKGRKRLHGAFTGGFSAGYFNTVGSKEGWTPSAFVSSRSTKAGTDGAKAQQQKVEDFMDDEDLADAEESRQLRTAGNFSGLGDTANDPMQLDHMANLLKPSGDTMGIKLLQRMGWKQGQGIGPKVRRKARAQEGISAGDDEQTHLFAPEDSRMIAFNQKADTKGLGFASENLTGARRNADPWQDEEEDDREEAIFRPSARKQLTLNRKKPTVKRGGIGMGISSGIGSDDEDDPYSIGPKMKYNRSIGANKAGNGDEVIKPILAKSAQTRPTFVARRKPVKQVEPTDSRTCHDGRLPLDGFVLATAALESMTIYDPPVIPEGWTSSRGKSEVDNNPSAFQSTADAAKLSTLDPKKRANLLGEEALPGKSVFDFLSEEARARIVTATGRSDIPQARGEALPGVSEKPRGIAYLIPELDRDTAAAALARSVSGWTPYGEDLGKRRRYLAFIELRAGLRDTLPDRDPGTTLDSWAQEMGEFAHAAQVFKPVSGLMASRFTSSARTFEGSKADEERDKSGTTTDGSSEPSLLSKPASARPEDPAVTAAKMGMFGPVTRSVVPFYPTRLLCKRFNVRPPENVQVDPGASVDGKDMSASTKVKDVVSRVTLDRLLQDAAAQQLQQKVNAGSSGSLNVDVAAAMTKLDEKPVIVDVERNEAVEDFEKRPGDAVFRAIFGDDSDDE